MAIHKSFRIMVVEDSATSAELTRCWLEDGLGTEFILHRATRLSSAPPAAPDASSSANSTPFRTRMGFTSLVLLDKSLLWFPEAARLDYLGRMIGTKGVSSTTSSMS